MEDGEDRETAVYRAEKELPPVIMLSRRAVIGIVGGLMAWSCLTPVLFRFFRVEDTGMAFAAPAETETIADIAAPIASRGSDRWITNVRLSPGQASQLEVPIYLKRRLEAGVITRCYGTKEKLAFSGWIQTLCPDDRDMYAGQAIDLADSLSARTIDRKKYKEICGQYCEPYGPEGDKHKRGLPAADKLYELAYNAAATDSVKNRAYHGHSTGYLETNTYPAIGEHGYEVDRHGQQIWKTDHRWVPCQPKMWGIQK